MRNTLAALAAALAMSLVVALPAMAQTYVQLGVPFGMRLGGEVEIEGQGMVVRLTDIVEDSRCPIDVMCVWAGRVVVALEVTSANPPGGAQTEEVTVDTLDQTATVRGVVFSLLQVKPSRRSADAPNPDDLGFLLRADIISP
ncbi:MAG: hypothetical protein AB7O56_04885 [Bauldia sp.]